ncbi:hypothetical protein O6H91_17G056400 [Diphasiastrum complanatum]|uniref:Uncharacterized protein n=1 Tax=Diphasiastrum complanatum TaxID=34168 RepID=A0ACC2B6Y2_DIPCM|nr:hypothetical protein O6H91_17G056400 [Diphasiastrum complanatum]
MLPIGLLAAAGLRWLAVMKIGQKTTSAASQYQLSSFWPHFRGIPIPSHSMSMSKGAPSNGSKERTTNQPLDCCWTGPPWDQRNASSADHSDGASPSGRLEWDAKISACVWESCLSKAKGSAAALSAVNPCSVSDHVQDQSPGMPTEATHCRNKLDFSLEHHSSFAKCRGEAKGTKSDAQRFPQEKTERLSEQRGWSTDIGGAESDHCKNLQQHEIYQSVAKEKSGQPNFIGQEQHKTRLLSSDVRASAKTNATDEKEHNAEEFLAENSQISLNLGKRIYFDYSSGAGVSKAGSSSTTSKKHRPSSSQASPVPSCQVQGCKTDLSAVKVYYRRHKVCEMHSKAPRGVVSGQEQRFCQQCSRFHVLLEFDEGKRSCRRRLAGHNERRRKPQTDLSATSPVGAIFLPGEMQYAHELDGSFFFQQRTGSSSVFVDLDDSRTGSWPGQYKSENQLEFFNRLDAPDLQKQLLDTALSGHQADRLLIKSRSDRPIPIISDLAVQSDHHSLEMHYQSLTPALSSQTVAQAAVEMTLTVQARGGIHDSGSALSLLSSESWGSKSSNSVALDLIEHGSLVIGPQTAKIQTSVPQLLMKNNLLEAQQDYTLKSTESLLSEFQSQGYAAKSISGSLDEDQQQLSGLQSAFAKHSMLSFLRGQDPHPQTRIESQYSHPVLNFANFSHPQVQPLQLSLQSDSMMHPSTPQFLGFTAPRSNEASIYDF